MNFIKKSTLGLTLAVSCVFCGFAQNDVDVKTKTFIETTKNVDVGGLAFSYWDVSAIRKLATDCIMSIKPGNIPPEIVVMLSDILTQTGIMNIEGFAVSSAERKNGTYVIRQSLYSAPILQKGLIWDIYGQAPHEAETFKFLPDTTVAALSTDINLAEIHRFVLFNLTKNAPNEPLTIYNNIITKTTQLGLDFEKAVTSIRSITLSISNDGVNYIFPGISGYTYVLETSDPALFKTFEKIVMQNDPASCVNGEIIAPLDPAINMTIFPVAEKYIVFTTEPSVVKNVISGKTKNLTQSPEYIEVSKGIPAQANSFVFISGKIGRMINLIASMNPEINNIVDMDKLTQAIGIEKPTYGIALRNENGFISVVNTGSLAFAMLANYGYANISTSAPVMAGMLLPALSSVRGKATHANCINNQKQLIIGMKMYSSDHNDNFPAGDGMEGFAELKKEGYLRNDTLFICPSDKVKDDVKSPYIYIGGAHESFSPDVPLIFDSPLNYHNGKYSFAFIDGHVETIPMPQAANVSAMVKQFLSIRSLPKKESEHLIKRAAEIDKKLGYTK